LGPKESWVRLQLDVLYGARGEETPCTVERLDLKALDVHLHDQNAGRGLGPQLVIKCADGNGLGVASHLVVIAWLIGLHDANDRIAAVVGLSVDQRVTLGLTHSHCSEGCDEGFTVQSSAMRVDM